MKTNRSFPILLFLIIFFHQALAQEKYSTVKIYAPADKTQRANLIGLLQIDHFQLGDDGAIIAEIGTRDFQRLKTTPYQYQVLVDDIAAKLETANRQYYAERASGKPAAANRLAFEQTGKTVDGIISTPSAFVVQPAFGGYYSFAQMNTAMNNLVSTYSTIAQKISLGKTHENRDIWCIKISDQVATEDPAEPGVLFIGLQHAREAIGGSSMIFFMQYLCENYATNQNVRDLVNNRQIYIIPCMNPDGWEYNRTNGGAGSGWRKNRRSNGDGTFGVDLNRNWGVDWGNCSSPIVGSPLSCGSNDTDYDTYYGPSAFSEPETQVIRDFAYTHRLSAMIDQHSYGPYYSLPFGRPSLPAHNMSTVDTKFYTYISSAMGNYNGMRAGNSPQALGYEVAGGVKDWMLRGDTSGKGVVYGLTGEGGAGGGTGGGYGSFWAPAEKIVDLCKGMVYQNLQLLYAAGSYVNLQDQNDINITSRTGAFNFRITRVGLKNSPVTISVAALENVMSLGPPVTITTLDNYYDTYNGSINYILSSALTNGQRVRFAWKIETGGYTYYDTVTKFYNATQLLYDDMEGSFSNNWISTATNSNPSVTEENWSFTTLDKFAGTKSMTESASGNYYSRTTRTATYKGTFNLSDATAAYLSFWTKHRAENFRDKLRVQVSANGTNWISIAGTTTVQEPGTLDGSTINGIPSLTGIKPDWTRELFDLGAWSGTPNLSLRFQFTSDGTTSFDFSEDDGFYIDNVKVVKTTANLITLPVRFISFTGRLLPNETIRLDWEAVTDDQHDYFEVEKSTDGSGFISLGRGPSAPPFWKIDPSPSPGANFYRIKQRDKDGAVTYSAIVSIVYRPAFNVSVYPNPVGDVLNVKINTAGSDLYTITVSDATGRKVHEEKIFTGPGDKYAHIDLKRQAAQLYILVVRNTKNEVVSTLKVVRK